MTTPADLARRFNELAALKPGWFNGEGISPDHKQLQWLCDRCSELPKTARQGLHVFPSPEGAGLLEWERGDWAPSLKVDLWILFGTRHAINLKTNEEQRLFVDLARPEVWQWVAEQAATYAFSSTAFVPELEVAFQPGPHRNPDPHGFTQPNRAAAPRAILAAQTDEGSHDRSVEVDQDYARSQGNAVKDIIDANVQRDRRGD